MDLSPAPAPAIAVLVDGENLSKDLAAASSCGGAGLWRSADPPGYGNLNAVSGWEDHGFRLCPPEPARTRPTCFYASRQWPLPCATGSKRW